MKELLEADVPKLEGTIQVLQQQISQTRRDLVSLERQLIQNQGILAYIKGKLSDTALRE
jgi:vacuolar-type H+-ATPase subunit D/Vma8